MKQALEIAMLVCVAILVLCLLRLLNSVNRRLLASGPILGGRIQPRGSTRTFPLVPTKDSERETNRPAVWFWVLVDLFVTIVLFIWYLARYR
jgi:hypothetical protein